MTTTINASTSAGLVQTADTSGNLSLQSGGTTILALTSTGAAVTGTLSSTSTTSLCTTSGTILDVGTADVAIGFAKTQSVLAAASNAGIVCKTLTQGYPVLAGWNAADAGDNVFTYWYVNAAGDNKGSIAYNRTANLVAYNTTSDATLKNLIGDAPQARSLEILSQTRLREYSWKEDETNKPQIGVIAQELYEVFPGAVSVGGDLAGVDEDGNPTTKYHPWSVDKTAYQFHLVAGWQNHETKIAALEARLAALEAK